MELDTDWISEFEIEDAGYKQFYKEKIKSIKNTHPKGQLI